MSNAASSISEAIEKVYQSFVLRDLLGFVMPGSVSLLSLWYLVERPPCVRFLHWLVNRFETAPNVGQVLAFLGASYLTAWVLQSVHYGLVDWCFRIWRYSKVWQRDKRYRKLFYLLSWPVRVVGIWFYMEKVTRFNHRDKAQDAISPSIEESPSLITRGALAPDEALKRIKGPKYPPRLSHSFSYTERASVLMVMTGNLAIAGIPFLIALGVGGLGWWTLVGLPVLLLVYLEYWRLWYARNLRHQIYVAASEASDSSPLGPSNEI